MVPLTLHRTMTKEDGVKGAVCWAAVLTSCWLLQTGPGVPELGGGVPLDPRALEHHTHLPAMAP